MNVFPACMFVDHTYVWCLWRSVRRLRSPGSVNHHMGPANWTHVLCKRSKCSSLLSCLSRPHIKVPNIKVGLFLSPGEDSSRFSNSSDNNWEFYHSYLPPSTQSMLQISRLPPIQTPALSPGPTVLLTMKIFINHGFQWSPPHFQELVRMNQELKKALCIQFLVYIKKKIQLQHIQVGKTYRAKHGGEGTGPVSSSGAPCIADTHTKPECHHFEFFPNVTFTFIVWLI